MDNFYYNNKKLKNIDSGESWGTNRLVKIWKENGDVFEFEEQIFKIYHKLLHGN